ncbi:Putative Type VI secretion system tube protein Hcp [Desulfonema limicola]|uniref:Type VI secretion system tube protein Hcp n=1 Tax=Desulfonema limicola TaxID=45656 RepID=A0A975GFV4_9BACT|nr:type VI secretion system tube protein TssD [Desulfonema limicola]QTA79706.1 Putative Type VI secretion system tube protein Hcp [Desulfonema limicola]
MPVMGFMEITGETQGKIEGSGEMPRGNIKIFGFEHIVEIPRSQNTGLPTGPRIHNDIVIVKEVDKSTPRLYKALCEGEKLTRIELSWNRPLKDLSENENYYLISLRNAIITRIQPVISQEYPIKDYKIMEKISFAYEKIIWTWKPDNIIHEDSWIEPNKIIVRKNSNS